MSSTPHRRTRGEQGIAIIMTSLCLLPLMVFAAFGVDLASWYSRISYLQKAADAAALAGTVWMPEINEATDVACESLAKNGVSGAPDCGTDGPFIVRVTRGSTATSLLVSVTDPNATRYFSQVFRGDQSLSRTAEAEYNMPLPLGSPLNYFGGDLGNTAIPDVTTYGVVWPSTYDATRPPAVAQVGETAQSFTCYVGATTSHTFGGWSNASTYNSSLNGTNRCYYAVTSSSTSGNSNVPPPDHTRRAPNSQPCRVLSNGTGASVGRWSGGSFSTATTGSESACIWGNRTSTSVPSAAYITGTSPVNRPCNVGYAASLGRWTASAFEAAVRYTGSSTGGNRLCRWPAEISTTVTSTPNPIPTDRSPGFWAMIYGPGQYAANGDAFSARCTDVYNCGSIQNEEYVDTDQEDRGYWYVIDVPNLVAGTLAINVFDASHNLTSTKVVDSTENAALPSNNSDAEFETEFRVFRQTNPLDFTGREPLFDGSNGTQDATNGDECWWELRKETDFNRAWATLCETPVSPGDKLLVNVRTNDVGASNSAGNNGYAIEAVINGDRYASPGPSIYAYGSMGMNNQNRCASPCVTSEGTFYLAKIAPQYAGKTLVIEMYDAGDSTGAGFSDVYPMKPSPSDEGAVVPVPAGDCEWTATPDPNDTLTEAGNLPSGEDPRVRTGVRIEPTSQPPNAGIATDCGVNATVSNVRQFNGEWLRIRVNVPSTYDCDPTVNDPENFPNSCWWGIRYVFSGNASDTTTWSARIEGNPVHLTS